MLVVTHKENPLLIDPLGDYNQVRNWRASRNTLSAADIDVPALSLLLVGEIQESAAEREIIDSTTGKLQMKASERYLSEVMDIAVFFHALSSGKMKGPADFNEAHLSSNGTALQSNVYEKMQEEAGNLAFTHDTRAFNSLFGHWISLFCHSPLLMDGRSSMRKIMQKNGQNYPYNVFNDPQIQDPYELMAAYDHRAQATRLIRKDIKMKEGERPLRLNDYQPHLDLILPYENSVAQLLLLQQRLAN